MARGPFIITMVAEPLVAANGELFGGKTLDREFRGWEGKRWLRGKRARGDQRRDGPFVITNVFSHGIVEIKNEVTDKSLQSERSPTQAFL